MSRPTQEQSSYREIEQKYPLVNGKEVISRLEELGAKLMVADQVQDDRYFVPAHRNFLDEDIVSEWLRIRTTDEGASINYKHWLPEDAEVKTYCDEFESKITDSEAVLRILMALNMVEIVRVTKKRSSWLIEGIEVSIDEVNDLGTFIELEVKSATDDVTAGHSQIQSVLRELGAVTLSQDVRGYPYQLLHREK